MDIGGYFGLELTGGTQAFHTSPYVLNSGRAAIGFILETLKPINVHLPFYTCDALLEPFHLLHIPYTFYAIDEAFELIELPELRTGELLLYINYFDIKRDYTARLSSRYGDRLLIDCTQAYFYKTTDNSWLFNSSRKFFGVPDGADLYIPRGYHLQTEYDHLPQHKNYLTGHLVDRYNGDVRKGYPAFQENEIMNGQSICRISKLALQLLTSVDYPAAMKARVDNFKYVHKQLKESNCLTPVIAITTEAPAPSFYPYLPKSLMDKHEFWDRDIFIPNFWPDCARRNVSAAFSLETAFAERLMPLPVDHRYSPADLSPMLNLIHLSNK